MENGYLINHQWHSIHDTLPIPGEPVLRYGQGLFGPHLDIGEVINKDGFRCADWGVTHWKRLNQVLLEAYKALPPASPVFTPEEWWFIREHQERCACGHFVAFHGGDGCLLPACACLEG